MEKANNPEVHAAAVQLATSRAQSAALIRAAAPRIEEALTRNGPTWLDFRRALIESRLRGLRMRWSEMADQVAEASDEDLQQAAGNWMLHLLKNIRPEDEENAPPQSPAETAAALIERQDFDGFRAFASNAFNRASERVARIMPEEEYSQITGNPQFDAGLKTYKKLLEAPIAQNHSENEGVFSTALGPLDTYYPLVPMTDGEVNQAKTGRSGRTVPYRKPKNIANAFATGLSEDYSPDMGDFEDRLRNAFRVNNKAALMQVLQDSNLARKLKRSEETPDTIRIGGVEYKAMAVEVSKDRDIITPKGTIHVPAQQMLIPAWLEDELRPILDKRNLNLTDPNGLMAKITKFTLAGPLDAVIHSANLVGTMVANTPFLGRNLAEKAVGNLPFTKRLSAMFQMATTDPTTEEAAEHIQEMAKLGVLPEKYGSMATAWLKSGRKYAEQTGAELSYGFGPMLYGPSGIDVRARLGMYRLAKSINPDASPKEMYRFVNQLGNYTRALQGKLERSVKESGWSPFYTAGSTMVRNGVNAWLGTGPTITPSGDGPIPGGKYGRAAMKALAAITGGAAGMVALWMLVHKEYTGQWPQDDRRAKFLKVRLNAKDRASWLAQKLYGPDGDAYVDLGYFSPLVARGARALGIAGWFETAQAGGSFGQKMDASIAGAFNAAAQPLLGPPLKAALVGLTGTEGHLTGWRDDRGKIAMQAIEAVKSQSPDAAGWAKQHLLAPLLSMNSLVSNLAAGTGLSKGLMTNADAENNRLMRMVVDMALPQLFAQGGETLPHTAFLARQRAESGDTERTPVSQAKAHILSLIRAGSDANGAANQAVTQGLLTHDQIHKLYQEGRVSAFAWTVKQMPFTAALEMYEGATPAERNEIRNEVGKKTATAARKDSGAQWSPEARTLARKYFNIEGPRAAGQ